MDCIFNREPQCAALKKKECVNCKFKKTKNQMEDCREKTNERILKLTYGQQIKISDKYYFGKSPWFE